MTEAQVVAATLRAKLNLIQKHLAERFGVSFATVNR
jgi:DNA-binding transcriptional regulator YiaG